MSFSDGLMDMVLRVHGVAATVGTTSVTAVPFDGYAEVEEIEGTDPMIVCRSSALPADLAEGTSVVISGKTYSVVEVQPDGLGATVLQLEYISG